MEEVAAKKKSLRKQMAGIIQLIPESQVQMESQLVYDKVIKSDWFEQAKSIALYVSTKGEINTDKLITFNRGTKSLEMIQLNSHEEYNGLETTLWGIRQHPKESLSKESGLLDVIIMTGMAFSVDGQRLGRGKGHYDVFLHKYLNKYGVLPKLVAFALKDQILEEVPLESHDVPLDHVVYAKKV